MAPRPVRARCRWTTMLLVALLPAFVGSACTQAGDSSGAIGEVAPSVRPYLIPQPRLDELNKRTRQRLASSDQRVDLVTPVFSDPTTITNPLFPVSELHSVVLVGKLHGRPWRAEDTLLPDYTVVRWNGRDIETLRSQFVAYLNGRIFEVAVDRYAQADDGSVWYFGEDAITYEHGRAVDTEGTWLAGVNGPPALIMPGDPHVGDVYRAENIPGLVFEQVTVKAVDRTVPGPAGPIHGAMIGSELHMDEVRLEKKVFAPGYGELSSGGGSTFEANALAVPADALHEPAPAALQNLTSRAIDVFDAARSRNWRSAATRFQRVTSEWETLRADEVPPRLATQMSEALKLLRDALDVQDPRAAGSAALNVARASLDIELRYRPPLEIDEARFELWTRDLQVDAAAGDWNSVAGDISTLGWIRDRIPLAGSDRARVDDHLRYLEAAAEAGESAGLIKAAQQLDAIMHGRLGR